MSKSFVDQYKARLADFTRLSKTAGARSDYVQGGGGNTSCKLDDRLMAIKASGFRLDQIEPDQAYAVLDYADLRHFYHETDAATLADIEQTGSARAKAATQTIEGLPVLRPSVEAGFHSLLDMFVLHSHAVYVNLLTCAANGRELAELIMEKAGILYAYVPYINPGAQLTFAVGAARTAASVDGRQPDVIFMENHGVIVTGNDVDAVLKLHDQVNQAIAAHFNLTRTNWPDVAVRREIGNQLTAAGAKARTPSAETYVSETPYLKQHLLETEWTVDFFALQALYPDQLVFLAGQVTEQAAGTLTDWLTAGRPAPTKCLIFRQTGEVLYTCGQNEALTLEQTLCAILFIKLTIRQAGLDVRTMNEAGKAFISNWESEKYRKTVVEK